MSEAASGVSNGSRKMLLLLLCACLVEPASRGDDFTVGKGSTTNIAVAAGIRKIVVGSDSIIAAGPRQDGKGAVVVGLAEGSSDLRIEQLQGPDLVYKVAVRSESQGPCDQIRELLSEVAGLRIKCVGGKAVLEGKIRSQADMEIVKKVQAAYPGAIIDLSTFEQPDMPAAIKTLIVHDLLERGLDSVTVQIVGDAVILDGVVYSAADMAQAVETAKLRAPIVKSLLR
ncbi:MAG TPA: hypothetical protein VK731_03675, partial [Candidatus Cybelea sp.]|nr:hypothetical protein [Candidatus Cybelea sp.]